MGYFRLKTQVFRTGIEVDYSGIVKRALTWPGDEGGFVAGSGSPKFLKKNACQRTDANEKRKRQSGKH
jgi:hypothetical protein